MAIPYCSLHERLFSSARGQWVDCSQEKINPVKDLYALLCFANIDSSTYRVIESFCDRCEEAMLQTPRDRLDHFGPTR